MGTVFSDCNRVDSYYHASNKQFPSSIDSLLPLNQSGRSSLNFSLLYQKWTFLVDFVWNSWNDPYRKYMICLDWSCATAGCALKRVIRVLKYHFVLCLAKSKYFLFVCFIGRSLHRNGGTWVSHYFGNLASRLRFGVENYHCQVSPPDFKWTLSGPRINQILLFPSRPI